MKLYKFSPIQSEEKLDEVWEYLATNLEKLAKEIFGNSMPINTLKVFPHYPEEYKYLHKLILDKGPKASFSSDTSLYVEAEKQVSGHDIKYFGVRIVDPYRLHVGCGDFEIENFTNFKKKYLGTSPYIREVKGDMIELWHPDYDVLGYIVPTI